MADKIVSRVPSDKYREEYDRIFKKGQADNHKGELPNDTSNKPQYGVVQSYNWRGPSSRATRQVDGTGVDIPESVDSNITSPITEDGSEPSSK